MLFNNILIFAALSALVMILVGRTWQYRAAGLAIVNLIAFILILQIWPLALASVKLISGWISVILISSSQISRQTSGESVTPRSAAIFRLLITLLVWIVITAAANSFNQWLPIPYTNLYIGLVIIAAGLIFASVSQEIFDVIIGVLILLAGFDIIYSSLEGSALVTGIYSLIVIFIALLNTYFSSDHDEVEE